MMLRWDFRFGLTWVGTRTKVIVQAQVRYSAQLAIRSSRDTAMPQTLKKQVLPPGPPGFMVFSRTFQQDHFTYYEQSWRTYGDVIRLQALPGIDHYLVVHPDHVEHVLTQTERIYRKPDLANKPLSLVIGQGLVTSEGPNWKRQRHLAQPA